MLPAIEKVGAEGTNIKCADGYTRHCFPILAKILADMEEQNLLTNVKHNQHCTTCIIPPNIHTHLLKRYRKHTHELTKKQIAKQIAEKTPSDDANYVHPVNNFA